MKKVVVFILIIFFTFLIYKINDKNLVDYLSLGDSLALGINSYGNHSYGYNDYVKSFLENNNLLHKYNSYYTKNDYTISELTSDINSNKTIFYDDKTYSLKKEIREADIITLSIGLDELISIIELNENKTNLDDIYPKIDTLCLEMDELVKTIKKYSEARIILIGYYNPYGEANKELSNLFAYISDKYTNIAKKYSINYLDIYQLILENKNYLPNNRDYHITSKGYLKIASEIIKKIESDF